MNTIGYIVVTLASGELRPVNIRSILKIEPYQYNMQPNWHSRIWLLDNKFINVFETERELNKEILRQVL
jgi:hypothetical protein